MKRKWVSLLSGVTVLTMIFFAGHDPAMAATPEELKLLSSTMGFEVPVPRFEISTARDWMRLLYDPLFGTTPDLKLSPEHGLATKWEMSRDGLDWTITLRKGVKFHDGVEMTAKDVKFSLEQVMLPDSTSATADEVRKYIRLLEIKDPYTLVIHCKKPSIFLHTFFADSTDGLIIPKDYYERVGKDQFRKAPIGTGPYKWHSQVVGSFIKLEATERHWRDGAPRYKYVTFLLIPEESSRLAMLKTGEGDITRISRGRIKEALNSGLKVIPKKEAGAIVFHCLMQWATPAFSDIRFRKALNLAIDRESMLRNILEGRGKLIAGYPGDNILACGGDPTLKPYPYDPQEARRLIKEGGYDGYEFTVPCYPRAGLSEMQQIAETVVGYWQKIGLKPKIFMTDWTTWLASWRARKVQNAVMGNDVMSLPECGTLLTRMEDRYASTESRAIMHDPKIDEWFKRARNALDMAEVAKNLGEVYRYVYDQHMVIPLCSINDEIAVSKRIPDWDPGLRRDDRNINDVIKQQ